ncbi:40s ribosomal protein s8 [Nicotiana attenuata]|uniref:40s ribosomal protein s8 n=1 Tax=Nicotiana attenuata TaxID=49451 RepID=A0A314LCU0_NICAT|nr:40s ribosomal protein s8 [Nicotiana attenuata]
MASYGTENYCGEFYQHPYGFEVNGVMQDPYANHCYDTNLGSLPNPYGFECIPRTTSVARDSKHKRCAACGKRKTWRKKHKYELGRQSVTAKLSSEKKVRRVHVQVSNGEWAPKFSIGGEIMKEGQPLVVEGNREIEVHVFGKISQREEINLKDEQWDDDDMTEQLEIDGIGIEIKDAVAANAVAEYLEISKDQLFE